jgi:hypothetical protein
LFRLQRDYLSYETLHHGSVAYHPFLLDRGRFLLQWRWPGNRSDPYLVFEGDGRYEATGDPSSVYMAATDFHGNEATLNFDVLPDTIRNEAPAPTASSGVGQVALDSYGEFIVLTASFDQPEAEMPTLQSNGENGTSPPQFFRVDAKTFRAAVAPAANAQQLIVGVAHPRIEPFSKAIEVFHYGAPARSVTIGGLTLGVASDIPYGVLFAAEDASDAVPRTRGLQAVTKPASIWPEAAPISGAVTIAINLPPGESRRRQLHVYRASGDKWARLDTEHDSNRVLASSGAFGTFSVLADEDPPTIGRVTIGSDGNRGPKRPSIRIPIHDQGAGIADYSVMCGSTWLLMAYDPENDVLDWEQDMDLPSGDQALSIKVTDHAGNVSTSLHPLFVQ